MHKIAIYDLDRTITRTPTFTPFLIFAAQRKAPWRLAFLPLWLFAMLGYRIGLYGRKALKQFGIALFIGRAISVEDVLWLSQTFAGRIIASDIQPGAIRAISQDKDDGYRLVIATAAPEFYATEIGRRLGFEDVIATKHIALPGGGTSHLIVGENCYGPAKLAQIKAWLASQTLERSQCTIRFYSDHGSDRPTFEWCDEAIVVAVKKGASTADSGWKTDDWSH